MEKSQCFSSRNLLIKNNNNNLTINMYQSINNESSNIIKNNKIKNANLTEKRNNNKVNSGRALLTKNFSNYIGEGPLDKSKNIICNKAIGNEFDLMLFSNEEKNKLRCYLPQTFINKCEERFISIAETIDEIKQNEGKNTQLKNELKAMKEKQESLDFKFKESNTRRINLYYKLTKLKQDKVDTNNKLKKLNVELNRINIKYCPLEKENKELRKKYQDIYSMIKGGKITLKLGEALTKENIEAMNKFGKENGDNESINSEINDNIDCDITRNVEEEEEVEEDDNNN